MMASGLSGLSGVSVAAPCVTVVSRPRAGWSEVWASGRALPGVGPRAAARALYRELARHPAELVSERLYGPLQDRDACLAGRADALAEAGRDPQGPVSFIDPQPGKTRSLIGLQAWGFRSDGADAPRPTTVVTPTGVTGREVRWQDTRLVWLASLVPAPAHAAPVSPGAQGDHRRATASLFARTDQALAALGLRFGHVARTWLHLDAILDWYGPFNEARNIAYVERARLGSGCVAPPASTGIGGTAGTGAIALDLLAVAGAGAQHAAPRYVDATSAQCSATAYGSAFARAAWVTFGGAATLHLSGTAAIDRAGRTVAVGDRDGQVRATFESVDALLTAQGLTLADLVSITAYVKDTETERAMERYLARAGLGAAILAVPVDLCRADLLFEIEGVAARPALAKGTRR